MSSHPMTIEDYVAETHTTFEQFKRQEEAASAQGQLRCQNGTLDLETGEVSPREDEPPPSTLRS